MKTINYHVWYEAGVRDKISKGLIKIVLSPAELWSTATASYPVIHLIPAALQLQYRYASAGVQKWKAESSFRR